MNKYKLGGLLIVVAFASEAAGVARANYHARKSLKNLKKHNTFLKLAADEMAITLDDINSGTPVEVAMERFNEQRQYIEIVNKL